MRVALTSRRLSTAVRVAHPPMMGTVTFGRPDRPPLCFLHLKPIVLARCASTDPFPISMQSPIRLGSPIAANVTMRVDS